MILDLIEESKKQKRESRRLIKNRAKVDAKL